MCPHLVLSTFCPSLSVNLWEVLLTNVGHNYRIILHFMEGPRERYRELIEVIDTSPFFVFSHTILLTWISSAPLAASLGLTKIFFNCMWSRTLPPLSVTMTSRAWSRYGGKTPFLGKMAACLTCSESYHLAAISSLDRKWWSNKSSPAIDFRLLITLVVVWTSSSDPAKV